MMAGLIGALAAGGAIGFANGTQQNTQAANQMNMSQLQMQVSDLMNRRAEERAATRDTTQYNRTRADSESDYTRGRTDKTTDYEKTKADTIAAEGRHHENELGLIDARKNPLDDKLKKAQINALDKENNEKSGKVTFQALGDGKIARVDKSGKVIGYMTDPETGKPILGKTDISESLLKLAAVYTDAAKAADLAGDNEAAKNYRQDAVDLLTKKQGGSIDDLFPTREKPGASAPPPAAQPASQPTRTIEQVDAEIKPLQKEVEVFGMDTTERKAKLKALYKERTSLLGNR